MLKFDYNSPFIQLHPEEPSGPKSTKFVVWLHAVIKEAQLADLTLEGLSKLMASDHYSNFKVAWYHDEFIVVLDGMFNSKVEERYVDPGRKNL